jgi:hypothetical protein
VAEAKKKRLQGGHNPSELARLSHERRRQNKAQQEEHAGKVAETDVSSLPRQRLIELLRDSRTRSADVVAAAKALAAIPADDDSTGWRASTQVREDFLPPDWGQVLLVARAAGAFDK